MNRNALTNYSRVLTLERLDTIVELTEDGWSAREIAAHLGVGQRTVEQGRQVMGITGRDPRTPGQYVDEVAVLRATWGEPVALNHDELTEAVRRMSRNGDSATKIARVLGVSARTVQRHRGKAERVAA